MARSLHARYGLDYVGLRYMNVYGPRQDYYGAYIAVIMKMLDCIDRGEPLVLFGDGTQAYDFVYVGDCAQANVFAMKASTSDRFYNVGTGVRTSLRELADLVLEITARMSAPATSPRPDVRQEPHRLDRARRAPRCVHGGRAARGWPAGVVDWRREHKREVDQRRAARHFASSRLRRPWPIRNVWHHCSTESSDQISRRWLPRR